MSSARHEIDIESAEYPAQLKELANPPKTLYVMGEPYALYGKTLAIVGARKCTRYGVEAAKRFAKQAVGLGYAIVSGGAVGIDTEAHWAALNAVGKTIAVMGCGADYPYPDSNKPLFSAILEGGGCIVSEQPWGTEPRPWMFPKRNRIIAGLSQAMLVPECKMPSGTFTACEYMANICRPLLAVPGSIFADTSKGTNHLISQREAHAVVDGQSFERWL